MDGSIINYTVTYIDSSGSTCDSVTIPASSCRDGICKHVFEFFSESSCLPSTFISMTVLANNILGDGPSSDPLFIRMYSKHVTPPVDSYPMHTTLLETTNKLFYVEFNSTDIRCVLRNMSGYTTCSVIVLHEPDNCTFDQSDIKLTSNLSDTVHIDTYLLHNEVFCFEAIAINASSTMILKGTFSTGKKCCINFSVIHPSYTYRYPRV